MADFEFRVIVSVPDDLIPLDDEHGRSLEGFAHASLWSASLLDARSMDGFADLEGYASIDWVEML